MPESLPDPSLAPLVWVIAMLALAGLAFVLYLRQQIRSAVGEVLHEGRPTMLGRRAQLAVALLSLATLIWMDAELRVPTAVALGAALGIALLRPGFEDSAYGTGGVQRGWFARRYADLDQWRLTGEHLRWQLYGDWLATEVPTAEHEQLRQRLRELVPERESRFQR